MKKLIAFFVFGFLFTVPSMAGTMFISPKDGKSNVFKSNLAEVGSIVFAQDRIDEPKKLKVKNTGGDKFLYTESVESLYAIKFGFVKPSIDEVMFIETRNDKEETSVDESVLKNVESIEIIVMDESVDSDKDGLSDYSELYMYETNPYVADTDGDGYNDKYEVDNFDSKNPRKFNPKIADLPELKMEISQLPVVHLILTQNNTETESKTITESTSMTEASTVNRSYTYSNSQEQGWSTNHSVAVGHASNSPHVVYTGSVGWNGKSSVSNGVTFGSSLQETMGKNYTDALTESATKGTTISGAKVRQFVKITNTGNIAYHLGKVSAVLSAFTPDGDSVRIADLSSEVNAPLKPGEVTELELLEPAAPLPVVERFIKNPGALFLTSASQEISMTQKTYEGFIGTTDFSEIFTSAYTKTANIIFDYGPSVSADESFQSYRVATQFKPNTNQVGLDDKYKRTTLKDIFEILRIKYEEGVVNIDGRDCRGLVSVGELAHDESKRAMWYVSVVNAASPKELHIWAIKSHNFSLEDIEVSAGDEVRIFYSLDEDGDGLSLYEESLLGTSDKSKDTDGDGINDYDEYHGWSRDGDCEICGPFKTNPALVDSDYDGLPDYMDPKNPEATPDPDPVNRVLGASAELVDVRIDSKSMVRYGIGNKFDWVNADSVKKSSTKIKFKTRDDVGLLEVTRKGVKLDWNNVSENIYEVNVNDIAIGKDTVVVKVTSQDGNSSTENNIIINGELGSLYGSTLSRSADRKKIIVKFNPLKDDRIIGYVIMRGIGDKNHYNSFLRNTDQLEPTSNKYVVDEEVSDNVKVVNVIEVKDGDNDYVFEDNVGGGSPYYTYKVYAYAKQGDKYIYAPSMRSNMLSVGRIKVTYQVVSVGTEYLWSYPMAGRFDMRVQAIIKNGNNQVHHYNYWFQNAGSSNWGNTVIWETMADDASRDKNSDDQPVDQHKYEVEIGSEGLRIDFYNDADVRTARENTSASVEWPYSAFVTSLTSGGATGQSGNAPKLGLETMTFTWGKAMNIGYDESCSACGDEPHAGYKMKFDYEFID